MATSLTSASWKAELDRLLKPNTHINGPFFEAYKEYLFHWGCAKFLKGSENQSHVNRRNAAAAKMKELNPNFQLDRVTKRGNTIYKDWSRRASANSRANDEKNAGKKNPGDMGGRGGQNATDFEYGGKSYRKGRGRRSED